MNLSRRIAFPGLLACSALSSSLIVVCFAAIATYRVGHWPFYSHPDPKDLGLPVLHIAALFSYPVGVLSLLAGLMLLIASPAKWSRADVVAFVAAGILWCVATPGRLFVWLID